jgi:mannose-1-phosphate guanylyltransferase
MIRKPILETIVDHLRRHDFNEIYVNTSYLPGVIEDYFRDGDRFGVRMAFSYEGEMVDGIRVGLGVHLAEGTSKITGPVYIGSGTVVEPGAMIEGPTVIGANCFIGAGARIRESVLWDYTRVAPHSFIDERIVVAGRFVEPGGDSIDLAEADLEWLLGDARSHPVPPALDTGLFPQGEASSLRHT